MKVEVLYFFLPSENRIERFLSLTHGGTSKVKFSMKDEQL